jgi:hypothetical protein
MNFWIFSISVMNVIGTLMGIALNNIAISLCWFYQPMSMGDLSIFCSLLCFLSSIVYSFPYRGLSHPLFIPYFFWGYCKWNYFLIFFICSLLVYKRLLIFVDCFCILLMKLMSRSFLGLLGISSCCVQIGIVWPLPVQFAFLLFLLSYCSV